MKVKAKVIETYKWLPVWLALIFFSNIYFCASTKVIGAIHLFIFAVLAVPFIFIHSLVCRHLYIQCKNKEGDYEL